MLRKIIEIDKDKCNGCGLCAEACHEGAIQMVEGKAQLVSDEYCDGLGDCLPECPTGGITIVEREAAAYDEEKVQERQKTMRQKAHQESKPLPCGCPGTAAKIIERRPEKANSTVQEKMASETMPSELRQWPVQLNLVSVNAPYLKSADILIAADCTAYAYAGFHKDFIKDKITLIGCPKLDDNQHYIEKLTEMFRNSQPNSITVVRMSVPCCGGIVHAVKEAMLRSQTIVNYNEVTVSTAGEIIK